MNGKILLILMEIITIRNELIIGTKRVRIRTKKKFTVENEAQYCDKGYTIVHKLYDSKETDVIMSTAMEDNVIQKNIKGGSEEKAVSIFPKMPRIF